MENRQKQQLYLKITPGWHYLIYFSTQSRKEFRVWLFISLCLSGFRIRD